MSTPPSALVSQNPPAPPAPTGVPEGVTLTPLERPSPSLWQNIKTGVSSWLDKQEETEKQAEQYVQQQQEENEAEAARKNQLFETNPEEFKKQHPLEYLYRKGYGTVENALVEPALEGAPPAVQAKLRPKVENLVEAGLGAYNLPKPGEPKPVISQGVILPEGGELGEEAEAFGAKPWQKTGEEIGPLYHGGKKLVSDVDLAKTGQRDAGFYGKGFYLTKNSDLAKAYGNVISEKAFTPDARVLDVDTIHPQYEDKIHPGLQQEIEANQRAYLSSLPKAKANPKLVGNYLELIDPNSKSFDLHSWIDAVNRYAETKGYDAVRFSDGEIVLKNPNAVTSGRQIEGVPQNVRLRKIEPAPKAPRTLEYNDETGRWKNAKGDPVARMDVNSLGFMSPDGTVRVAPERTQGFEHSIYEHADMFPNKAAMQQELANGGVRFGRTPGTSRDAYVSIAKTDPETIQRAINVINRLPVDDFFVSVEKPDLSSSVAEFSGTGKEVTRKLNERFGEAQTAPESDFLYHGTTPSSAEEIRKTGVINAGDFTSDLSRARTYASNSWNPNAEPGPVFVVRRSDAPGLSARGRSVPIVGELNDAGELVPYQRPEEEFDRVPAGRMDTEAINSGRGFILSDGSWAGVLNAEGRFPHGHEELLNQVGEEFRKQNPIRINGPNAFDIDARPTEQQRAELSRIYRESGEDKVVWDFHPTGKKTISGEGSLGDFQRALDSAWPSKSTAHNAMDAPAIQKSMQVFGTTSDPEEAGFILPDGRMLDFSGKKEGGQAGTRSYDHRDIWQAFEGLPTEDEQRGGDFLSKFERLGGLRLNVTDGDLNVTLNQDVPPTEAQMQRLRQIIGRNRKGLYVEIYNKDDRLIGNLEKDYARQEDLNSFVKKAMRMKP